MRSPLLSGALKDDAPHLTGVLARTLPATGPRNPSLASGSASLFNRLYPLTAEPACADAARFWVVRTLELCSAPARAASAPGESAPGAKASGTAAPGAAAPARVPLDAASTVWDQMLLVSSIENLGAQLR